MVFLVLVLKQLLGGKSSAEIIPELKNEKQEYVRRELLSEA